MLGANTGVGFGSNGFSALTQQAVSAIVQAITNFVQQIQPTLPTNPFAGSPPQTPADGGTGDQTSDETSDTGDQGTINQGQTLPGSGNRPPQPSSPN
jgi:hypothetical protein